MSLSLALSAFVIACSKPPAGPSAPPDVSAVAPTWVEATWVRTRPLGRQVAGLVYDPLLARTLLVGGQAVGPLPMGDTWAWKEGGWTLVAGDSALPARKNFGIAYDTARSRVVVFGGIVGGLAVAPTYLQDTWEWTGDAWVERLTTNAPPPRAGLAMTFDEARGRVVLFGGIADADALGDTWEYDGDDWYEVTSTPTTGPAARFNTRMIYDSARQRSVLFGGQGDDNFNDLWAWDGAAWEELTPEGAKPAGRGFFAMAYDRGRDRIVVQGGTTAWPPFITAQNTFKDQWELDGSAWLETTPTEGPGRLSGHDMVYDASRGRLVLFGGSPNDSAGLDQTWEQYVCDAGESRCDGDGRLSCDVGGGWVTLEACAGQRCAQVGSEASCVASGSCPSLTSELTIARYDDDIFGEYRVATVGEVGGGRIDFVELRHPAGVEGVIELVDPRLASTAVEVRAWRGDAYFAAVGGTVTLSALGDDEGDFYFAETTNLTFEEVDPEATTLTFVPQGDAACLEHAVLQALLVRYLCRNLEASLEPGDTTCVERQGQSLLVRCEEGLVEDSLGNLGRLVVETNCTAASATCQSVASGSAACVP